MSNRILKYLPDYFREILDYVELADTEDIELQDMDDAIQQLFDDQFILTSNLDAVKRREKIYNIQADPTTETLDFRKQRLLNRKRTRPPFTVRWLQKQLDLLVGPGMTIVSVDYPNRTLIVTTNIENANVFKELLHTIQTVKPANMLYQQNTTTNDIIGLEEHISKQDIIWNYGLGTTWQLGQKPFATLGSEEVIK